jgi:xanthine dehydrogenase YagS FAD-binding subunit
MKNFVLLPARSLEEAARAAAHPDTELKAGGVDLIDRMKEGIDTPERVVSIAHLPGLNQIQMGPPAKIGALATLASIAQHADIQKTYPALAAAADGAATPQIRNMATLGGNLCQRPRCWYYRLSEFDCQKKVATTATRRTARTGSTRSSTRTCSACAFTHRQRPSR